MDPQRLGYCASGVPWNLAGKVPWPQLTITLTPMKTFAPTIVRFDSLASTNTEAAQRAAEGAPEGLCVVAEEQTAGRGRLQRDWLSPRGAGLYFSVVLRPRIDQRRWSLITLMASIAVHDALLRVCSLESDIKWPNDILVNQRKLSGILAETLETPLGRAAILGIGINLTSEAFPPQLSTVATSVESITGRSPDLDQVLYGLLEALEHRYEMLQTPGGPEMIVVEWCKRSSYTSGKRVRIENGGDSIEGITRGLESDGALRVETEAGDIRVIRAGDVTLVRASVNGEPKTRRRLQEEK